MNVSSIITKSFTGNHIQHRMFGNHLRLQSFADNSEFRVKTSFSKHALLLSNSKIKQPMGFESNLLLQKCHYTIHVLNIQGLSLHLHLKKDSRILIFT